MRSTCIPVVSEHHWNCIQTFPKVPEKEFKATFEIKGKALYQKLMVLFAMMREILMESKLGDESV